MNFKFQSLMENNNNPPNPSFNGSANFSYFTQQSIRARYTSADVRRHDFDLPRNPIDIRGSIQRELEKERIRAELIREEIMRRRIIEEEVRRELLMERELTLRGYGPGFGMGGSVGPMRLEQSRVPLLTNYEHGGRDDSSRDVGFQGGLETRPFQHGGRDDSSRDVGFQGGLETRPFQRDPVVGSGSSVGLHEIKELNGVLAPQSEGSKDKVIILAKPSINLADIKRKSMTPPVGSAIEVYKKQKTEEDWSCALCRITATSARGLQEHLQGKKHKARERGTISERTGFGTGPSAPLPNTSSASSSKPFTLPATASTPTMKNDEKVQIALTPNQASIENIKREFRYFCEMCQRGAFSMKVFRAHNRSKRHLAKLSEFSKNNRVAFVETSVVKALMEENKGVESDVTQVEDHAKVLETADGGTVVSPKTTDQETVCNLVESKGKVQELVGGEIVAQKTSAQENICSEVEDTEKSVGLVGGETTAPKFTIQESVCNLVVDKGKALELLVGCETVTSKTTDREFVCSEVEDEKVLKLVGRGSVAPMTNNRKSGCNEVEDNKKAVELVGEGIIAPLTTYQEAVCNKVEDKEMILDLAGGEAMATKTASHATLCREVENKKVLEIVGGETMAPKTTDDKTVCNDVDEKEKVLELVDEENVAPMTIDQEFACNKVEEKDKVPELVNEENVAPMTVDQEFVCNEVEEKDKVLELVEETVTPMTTSQESVCNEVADKYKDLEVAGGEAMASKNTDQECVCDRDEDKEMILEVAGDEMPQNIDLTPVCNEAGY